MENNKRSYYAIIPGNVRYDDNLTPNAKLLYGEITALCNERGYCWASNSYFAELYSVKNNAITNWVTQLKESGYIHVEYEYRKGTKQIAKRIITLMTTYSQKDRGVVTEECGGSHKKVSGYSQKGEENNTFNTTVNNTNNINNSNNNINNNKQTTFNKVENEFGRPLSPIEMETIKFWDEDYTEDMIDCALREAVLNSAFNFKYIEKILVSWEKKNLKTIADIQKYLKKFSERNDEPAEEKGLKDLPPVPLYNWANS